MKIIKLIKQEQYAYLLDENEAKNVSKIFEHKPPKSIIDSMGEIGHKDLIFFRGLIVFTPKVLKDLNLEYKISEDLDNPYTNNLSDLAKLFNAI